MMYLEALSKGFSCFVRVARWWYYAHQRIVNLDDLRNELVGGRAAANLLEYGGQ